MKLPPVSIRTLYWDPIHIPWSQHSLIDRNPPVTARKPTQLSDEWDMSYELLRWSGHFDDNWTLEDALRGTQILGATGGGKTTGAGAKIARSFLRAGFGGLVLCVKEDEGDLWEALCKKMGRSSDLIRIRMDGPFKFNFLDAEARVGGKLLTQNVSEFFAEVLSIVNRTAGTPQKDPFWTEVLMTMLNHTIVLQTVAEGKLSLSSISRIISAAVTAAQNKSDVPMSSLARKNQDESAKYYLREIFENAKLNSSGSEDVIKAIEYLTGPFAHLAEKTRSIVVMTFTSMADALMRKPLSDLLCSDTTVRPEDAFQGKILVVDVPIHLHRRVGRMMNLVWKTAFKRVCQRRKTLTTSRLPVFLWSDESQYLVDQIDGEFQTTARSSLCCTVLLTQNLANYYAEIHDKPSVDSLLGSLHNKIYHQNGESETNAFASKSIGKVWIENESYSQPSRGALSGEARRKRTVTRSGLWDYDVPERVFTNLRSGGWRNRFQVDAIIHLPGRKFSTGRTWMKAVFKQRRGK